MNLLPVPRSCDLDEAHLVPVAAPIEHTDASLPAQGYELRITGGASPGSPGSRDAAAVRIDLTGADAAGLFYGRATLAQLVSLYGGRVPVGTVRDHPDLAVRGVMLDISRDKVPTTERLYDLVDRLASWKVNQLQLYAEHTFAYRNHAEVWAAASPVTGEEMEALDDFCRRRHVELVPNQNCLGHMNRWLAHERYRPLAIAPEGFTDPYGIRRAPMTIEPNDPGSLDLVRELLAELLPHFTSRRVHVGLDEAWELPPERMDDYLRWAATLRALPELDGYEMLMWGDMVSGRPELVSSLPPGVTVCEWGYDDWYPFDERCAVLAAAGLPFWVAPGTSSWLSLVGRVTNATTTCANAAAAALAHGATGFLNTDWGDQGHLQQPVISDPGFAYGAAVSWCLEANAGLDLAAALSAHDFSDPTGGLASALLGLGDAHLLVTPQFPNMSAAVSHLYYPQLPVGRALTAGITAAELDALSARLHDCRQALRRAQPARADGPMVTAELDFSLDVMALLVRDAQLRLEGDGMLRSVPEPARRQLAAELGRLIDRYRELWLARNRPGGLTDSVAWLENLRAAYETGRPDPGWGGLPGGGDAGTTPGP